MFKNRKSFLQHGLVVVRRDKSPKSSNKASQDLYCWSCEEFFCCNDICILAFLLQGFPVLWKYIDSLGGGGVGFFIHTVDPSSYIRN